MGARGDLPLTLRYARRAWLALALLLTGCIDFVEPDLPAAGAAAFLQLSINVLENGSVQVSGQLAPGLSVDGEQRDFPDGDSLIVYGFRVPSASVGVNGTRNYQFTQQIGASVFTQLLDFAAPRIEGVQTAPPTALWPVVRKLSGDTISINRGEDLILRVQVDGSPGTPVPLSSQWNAELVTTVGNFRFGGGGLPPAEIRVPSYYIPTAPTGEVAVYVSYFLSTVIRPAPGDYIVNLNANVRTKWIVKLR